MVSLTNSIIITFSQWLSGNNVCSCYRDQTGNPYESRPLFVQCYRVQFLFFFLVIAVELLGIQTYTVRSDVRLAIVYINIKIVSKELTVHISPLLG